MRVTHIVHSFCNSLSWYTKEVCVCALTCLCFRLKHSCRHSRIVTLHIAAAQMHTDLWYLSLSGFVQALNDKDPAWWRSVTLSCSSSYLCNITPPLISKAQPRSTELLRHAAHRRRPCGSRSEELKKNRSCHETL